MKTITTEELRQLLDTNEALTLIEALPPRYYASGHLPGAINIPLEQVLDRARTLVPDPATTLVVYCASTECQNSMKAAVLLEAIGYQNVIEYVDGKQAWQAAGLALEEAAVPESA